MSEHAEASAGLVPWSRVRRAGSAVSATAGSLLRYGLGLEDADDALLVVHRVRHVLGPRPGARQVLLPGSELAVVLPARPVEELVEDHHGARVQARGDQAVHRHGG